MENKNFHDFSIKQLQVTRIFAIIVAAILIIVGCTLMPFGIVLIVIGAAFLIAASSYKKAINEKTEYETNLNAPLTNYVIIDFETTGLNPKTDRIIEVGALKVANGEIVDKYSTYVNPMKHITKKVTDLNGISDATVSDAPLENDIILELCEFLSSEILVGYNINFDLTFLNAATERHGIGFIPGCTVDVLKLVRSSDLNLENHKLETVMKLIEPDFIQKHQAIEDCYSTKKILDYIGINKPIRELMQ